MIGLIFLLAWLLRRVQQLNPRGTQVIKLISTQALGPRERLVLAVPEGWQPASRRGQARLRRGEVALAEAADAPLILFPRRSAPAFYDIITGCYAAHGLTPHVGQEAIQMQTIVSLVSAGMGVALVPESLRHLRRTGVRYLDLPAGAAPHVETGLIWRRQAMTPALQSFVEIARTMSS